MNEVPEAVLILLNMVIAPAAVWVLQELKQRTGWGGPRMAKVACVLSFFIGAAVALVLGLATLGEVLSPFVLIGSGGITSAITAYIYDILKARMGWSKSAGTRG